MCKPIKDQVAIMKKIVLLYTLLLLSVAGLAQQQTQSSFNYLNGFNINKSYAGKDACSQIFLQHKNQWVGVEDAPTNLSLQAHTQLPKHFGLGLSVNNWSAGLLSEFDAAIAVAKHFSLSKNFVLSPSFNVGYSRFSFNADDVVAFDSDSYLNQSRTASNSFYADFGLLATYKRLEVGISLPKLLNTDNSFDIADVDPTYNVESYFKAHAAYDYALNDAWDIKPMLVYRTIPSNGDMLDAVAAVDYKNTVGVAIGYRTNSGLLASANIEVKNIVTIGYAYDAGMQQLAGISSGSHEILLGIKFCKASKDEEVEEEQHYYLGGELSAADGEPIADAQMVLKDELTGMETTVVTDSTGKYRTEVAPGRTYAITATHPDYEDYQGKVTSDATLSENAKSIALEHQSVTLNGVVLAKVGQTPLEGVTVTLPNGASSTTNKAGEFENVASKTTLTEAVEQKATLSKAGYHDTTLTYTIQPDSYAAISVQAMMREKVEVIENQPVVVDDKIEMKPIYFEVSSAKITAESYKELDQVVALMNANPTMKIEVNAHTDCTGSASGNQTLSNKRAEACANYIASKISNPSRITGKGFGETQPLTDCACQDCSGADHAKNRRTEFVIVEK